MVKVPAFRRLLLVSLLLVVCRSSLVAAQEDALRVLEDVPKTDDPPAATTQTFGLFPFIPYYPWLPQDTCGWDYPTTGYWWVEFSGATDCNPIYAKTLNVYAKSALARNSQLRSFSGSLTLKTPICTLDRARRRVRFVVQATGKTSDVINKMRTQAKTAARGIFSRSNAPAFLKSAPATYKYFASDWVSDYWCNGCPLTPAETSTTFGGKGGVTYGSKRTFGNTEFYPYTCPEGYEPADGTYPVCNAVGWRFSWKFGSGGAPVCVPIEPPSPPEPVACGEITADDNFPADAASVDASDADCAGTAVDDGTCTITCLDDSTVDATCTDGAWDIPADACAVTKKSP